MLTTSWTIHHDCNFASDTFGKTSVVGIGPFGSQLEITWPEAERRLAEWVELKEAIRTFLKARNAYAKLETGPALNAYEAAGKALSDRLKEADTRP